MLIKEKVLEEIETLDTQQLFDVYSLITNLKLIFRSFYI